MVKLFGRRLIPMNEEKLMDARAKEKIREVVEVIKEEIIRELQPKSIFLKGSFGRDEVSVKFDNDLVIFLSDYEVIVIPNRSIKRQKVKKLSENLTKKLGLKVEIATIEPELKFCITTRLWNKILPTIENYELKYGSKVIYGENFLERLPNFKAEDIPMWEGIRLMLNRMIESLQYFSIDYLNKYPSKEAEQNLFFWTNKIILACQDALLILAKRYHYSYKVRNETFQEIFPKHFKALDRQIPNFLPLTVKATEYKLNPKEIYSKDVVEFWFDVAEIIDRIFRYIIEKDMGITFNSYIEFQEKYLNHPYIRKKYYRGLSPNTIYQNLRSAAKILALGHKVPSIKLMRKNMIPWTHIVYSMIPIAYFGLSKNDRINEAYFERIREIISWFKGLKEPKRNSSDECIKEVLNLWYYICY